MTNIFDNQSSFNIILYNEDTEMKEYNYEKLEDKIFKNRENFKTLEKEKNSYSYTQQTDKFKQKINNNLEKISPIGILDINIVENFNEYLI